VGDEIRIGPFRLTYTGTQLTQQDESSSIRIDALNLKKTGSKNVILLNDISLAIPPRKFVALVGGSGAGKSTLMDALNGLRPAQQGQIFYNGQDYYQNLAAFSTQLGYVPQDDIIHRELSVERALYFAAKLRLPDDFTEAQIRQRVEEVLEDVEMKHRRNLLVSRLSGGQRKRVSIALELLAKPNVFFLDEPTSGLDPGLDLKMMLLLRKLADKGHTIILVTHATTNINVCDYVCFLAQGGRLAYYGPPDDAKAFFSKATFAEIYSALEPTEENPNIPAQVEAGFKASPDYQRYVVAPLMQGPAGQVVQQSAAIKPPLRGQPLKAISAAHHALYRTAEKRCRHIGNPAFAGTDHRSHPDVLSQFHNLCTNARCQLPDAGQYRSNLGPHRLQRLPARCGCPEDAAGSSIRRATEENASADSAGLYSLRLRRHRSGNPLRDGLCRRHVWLRQCGPRSRQRRANLPQGACRQPGDLAVHALQMRRAGCPVFAAKWCACPDGEPDHPFHQASSCPSC